MSRKMLNFSTKGGGRVKIYDYEGKKNICGERIRQARVILKLSQSELAAKMQVEGITIERDSISRIEIGTRFVTDYELMIFAKVLKADINWLLTGSKETP